MLFKELGNRLKSARLGIGLSQLEFAKKLEITDKTLRNYEKGKNITFEIVKKISNLSNTDFNYLLNGKNEYSAININNIDNKNGNFAVNNSGNVGDNTTNITLDEDVLEIAQLLQEYASSKMKQDLRTKLLKIKQLYDE